jgi:asparagine synthase (glutamine-hydrolysing)
MYSSSRDIEALGFNIDVLRALQGQFGQLKNGALRDIQCVDIAFNLPNDMLRKVDYASMFHSLEVRLPFLDSRLVHMAVSWPDKYKIDGGQRKRILKDTFSDLLPAAIRKRGKQGFLLPVRQWLRAGVLRERLREQVETQTRFDRAHLRARLSEHESGRYDHTEFLWMLYVYLQWVGSRRLRARR